MITHIHTWTHLQTHKPSSTHAELLLSECCKWKQSCWEICVETYAAVGVTEALIRLRNLILDPPSKPSSYTHTHTDTQNTSPHAAEIQGCVPEDVLAVSHLKCVHEIPVDQEEINRNLTCHDFLWWSWCKFASWIAAAGLWRAASVDCANDSLLSHANLSLQPKGNIAMIFISELISWIWVLWELNSVDDIQTKKQTPFIDQSSLNKTK